MITNPQPSDESMVALVALKSAVAQALEKKMKLGQYAVIWKNGKTEAAYSFNKSAVNNEQLTEAES
jgi:hypothetical protein